MNHVASFRWRALRSLASQVILVLASLALGLGLQVRDSEGGGIGVATDPEISTESPQSGSPSAYWVWRPGTVGEPRHRDLEFLLDYRYGIGLTPTVTSNLRLFRLWCG